MFRTWSWQWSLLAALLAVAAGAPQRKPCPAEGSGAKSSDSTEGGVVFLQNYLGVQVSLYWVNSEGRELPIMTLDVDEDYEMDSYRDHVWRVRESSSKILVLEHRVSSSVPREEVMVSHCKGLPATAAFDDAEWSQVHGKRATLASEGCPLDALLSTDVKGTMRGFHVMCAVSDSAGRLERLCIFADGQDSDICSHTVVLWGGESVAAVGELVHARVDPSWQPHNDKSPRPAIFTASGRRLPNSSILAEVGVPEYRKALVFILGGVWHWPGIREGFERPMHAFVHTEAHRLTLRTLSLRPRIFGVTHFIADAECDRTLEVAGPKVQKSQVTAKDADRGKSVDEWRTSSNFFLPSVGDEIFEALDERVQNLTRVPITHSEPIQVLKYDHNGRYLAHTDYFDPKDYQKDKRTLGFIGEGAWNRLLTVFMYMSDVEEGGETYFPMYGGGRNLPKRYEDCTGYSVHPERRKVIIFYNMHPDGQLDRDSLHGGCKVKNGTKWSGNFWFWNAPRHYKKTGVHEEMAQSLERWDKSTDRAEEQVLSEFVASLQRTEEL